MYKIDSPASLQHLTLMCNLWLKLSSIIYLSSTISPLSVLYGLLSRPPLLLSLALSSNLTLMLTHFVTPRWLLSLSLSFPHSLSLSLSPSLGGQECPQTHFSPEPPFPLPLSFTLSNSLHLLCYSPLRTHSIVNKAGDRRCGGNKKIDVQSRGRVNGSRVGKFEKFPFCRVIMCETIWFTYLKG